ncbi:MAG: type II toxin-antitoxin system HicB family antitoxin [Patescibacteria group bacterium]
MKDPIYTFRIMIEKDGKGYHGFVPTLKGVHTCGHTIEETKRNLDDAISCHIEGLLKDGETVPREEDSFEFVRSFVARKSSLTPVSNA